MRLVEHSAFDDAIRAAASHYGLLTEWIRKDYWVTRALEAIAQEANLKNRVVFKGGTSLSKGWSLIDRFSEDIDLLVTGPYHGEVPESKK
jgi:predicted nucleotidyltransferase component of viral defense system